MSATTFQTLRLRYPARCASCSLDLPAGSSATWHPETKRVRCVSCSADPVTVGDGDPFAVESFDRGVAGASALRVFEQRGQTSWKKGAEGERSLGRRLDGDGERDRTVLHDRRIPGSRANIDHLVVAPTGVFVIDAKKWAGKVEFATRDFHRRVVIGGRDRTDQVAATLERQTGAVAGALKSSGGSEVPIHPVMCLVDGTWPFWLSAFRAQGVLITYPRDLLGRVERNGPLTFGERRQIATLLAARLLPA